MRLEVLIGSQEPKIYLFKNSKLTLGTSEFCDIIVNAEGVSRKHVIVTQEDDRYFVTDQGSTNGTFVNDERLVPGRKTEFTSFFPVRLGDKVLVSLISLDELDDIVPRTVTVALNAKDHSDSSTRQISLKELTSKKTTEKLVLESKTKRAAIRNPKVKSAPKSSGLGVSFTQLLGILMVAGAGYYSFYMKEVVVEKPVAKVGQVVEVIKAKSLVPQSQKEDLPEATSHESLAILMNDLKCTTENEKFLCDLIPGAATLPWGVVQSGTKLNVLLDANEFIESAKKLLPQNPSEQDLKSVVTAAFILSLSPELELTAIKDLKMNFALFTKQEDKLVPLVSFILSPQGLLKLRQLVNSELLGEIPNTGTSTLNFMKDYVNSI
jgi:pSer/pThr/pTyr-binding forkhead associated (FHA) protein